MTSQVMDNMDIEKRENYNKGSKCQIKLHFKWRKYILNLIDTPGHVDFSYEVSRSLASSEGALLIVDSTQGVEAQTIANVYIAMDNDLRTSSSC